MKMRTSDINSFIENIRKDIIEFAQNLVKIKSYTGKEQDVAVLVEAKMRELGYDHVFIDKLGNVLGTIGVPGPNALLFDSHMDTVPAEDTTAWHYPPFEGVIDNGKLYGRGAVDMKCGLAASVYAGYACKILGLANDKCIYVSASVMEEDYDGVALYRLIGENSLQVSSVVLCEPTDFTICIGHNGRVLLSVTAAGRPAHGSQPQLGDNPIYKISRVATHVEALNESIKGTAAVTKISSEDVPTNCIPSSASLLIDRRLDPDEGMDALETEMGMLCECTQTQWSICDVSSKTWKGQDIVLHSYLPGFRIQEDHHLVQTAEYAFRSVFFKEPQKRFFGFSTNAVSTAGLLGIPSIVIGPGDPASGHTIDECCDIEQLIYGCKLYAHLCAQFWHN